MRPITRFLRLWAFIAATVAAQHVCAACHPHTFTSPGRVNIGGDAVLIVTHASEAYDARLASKRGVEQAIRYARSKRIPLVYLADDAGASPQHFFIDDCNPSHWVYSKDGEAPFELQASHLYLVGGHLEVCLLNTLQDVITRWVKQGRNDVTITYFMDGIYSNGSGIAPTDPYHKDYIQFLNVVSYGRPSSEAWLKLTLLETMGIIVSEHRQLEYAERVLPYYRKLLPANFRVEIKLNDMPPKVLQRGNGPRPPVMHFEFFDSATASGSPRPPGSGA